jgi:iron complex outermembrane receptor protein
MDARQNRVRFTTHWESSLKTNLKVTYAVLLALAGARGGMVHAADVDADADTGNTLGEVVVTAQRRNESIQDVPITIQAITGEQLKTLSVDTLDDVIKYTPNVTLGTNGPGQADINIRGLSAGSVGGQSTATFASFPNVAVYLDDQSLQFPGHNADVYLADIERIEVLEGPQGTLFGGGAEAGAIRYITNKPNLTATSGNAEATYGWTTHGDPNTAANLTLNVPLIDNTLGARLVIYDDRRGGYIDNVPSLFTRSNNDSGNHYADIKPAANGLCPNGLGSTSGFCVPLNNTIGDNFSIAHNASNPVEYNGLRGSVLWKISDDWDALIVQSFQNLEADGVSTQYPVGSNGQPLGPWQVTQFVPAYDKDRYENTALTVNGKIGDLKAVYTGGFLDRHIDQVNDYSNYTRSTEGFYYTCAGGGGSAFGSPKSGPGVPAGGTAPVCYSPITSWRDQVTNKHLSQEFRLSTPDDWRLRGILGAYYENYKILDNMNFMYKTIPSCEESNNLDVALAGGPVCVANVGPIPGSTANDPSPRGDSTAFGEDIHRGYGQTAFFGSADFDIVPKVLTLTAGTRWYHYTEYELGSKYETGFACENIAGPCYGDTTSIDAENEHKGYHGFKSRANLTWHVTPDILAYFTYSEGFRPGGFNRTVAKKADDSEGNPQYNSPLSYAPDSLINYELGLKSEWLDHHAQVNLSVYRMEWDSVQFALFDPTILGNTTFVVNGPSYQIDGVELQLALRPFDGLTIQGTSVWNSPSQTNSPCLLANNPAASVDPDGAKVGQCITQIKGAAFPNPFGLQGYRPAFSPSIEFNLRARYEWAFGSDFKAFAQAGLAHVGDMSNQPASYFPGDVPSEAIPTTTHLRYDQPSYTTYDAAIGIGKDNWTVKLVGENLGNSDASTFTSSAQFIKSEVPLRPRVINLTAGYKF